MRLENEMATHQAAKTRERIAHRAARLMAEDGVTNYRVAKQKAAERLGINNTRSWPDNRQIESALSEYQRLFQGEIHRQHVTQLRRAALQAMRLFAPLHPKLVGSVLKGTAGPSAVVSVHVFTDAAENVCQRLFDHNIPFEDAERRLRTSARSYADYPAYRFVAGEISFELVVFPTKNLHQAPLSPVDGRPMQRAEIATVESLLSGGSN